MLRYQVTSSSSQANKYTSEVTLNVSPFFPFWLIFMAVLLHSESNLGAATDFL